MNVKAQINLVHIIVGILLIAGGVLFLINEAAIGGIIATLGLLIEMIVNLIK